MGSKVRVLDKILETVASLSLNAESVWDVFSGSSVVSQAFAYSGFNVRSTDALLSSVAMAKALLGVGYNNAAADDLIALDFSKRDLFKSNLMWLYDEWIAKEIEALSTSNTDILFDQYFNLPQYWRPAKSSPQLLDHFNSIQRKIGQHGVSTGGFFSSFYSGTYFGIQQAIEIDSIRLFIHELFSEERITSWQRDVLVTALLTSISDSVYSAGKHFAQPHNVNKNKNLDFQRKRILSDRGKSIDTIFKNTIAKIIPLAASFSDSHESYKWVLDEKALLDEPIKTIDLIYADPPYTAQQYSRFYHIPEIVTEYHIPKLTIHKGKITTGLYPNNRYKSPFCLKSLAPNAFTTLFMLTKKYQADLLLSYSGSKNGVTGNERMTSIDNILSFAKETGGFNPGTVIELDHNYREFNKASTSVQNKNDSEYLIHFRRIL